MHHYLPECEDKYCPHCKDKLIKAKTLTKVVRNPLKIGDQVYKRKDLIDYLDNKNINREENTYLNIYTIVKVCDEDLNKYWIKSNDFHMGVVYYYEDLVVIPTPKFKENDIVRLKINYNKWRIIDSLNSDPNRLDSNYKNYFIESVDDTTIRITAFEYELELYTPPKRKFPWNLFQPNRDK